MKQILKIKPIGGVGQIGSNMTQVIAKDTNIIIDAGILFPYENFFNINYLIPDLSELKKDPPEYLIITHGHEDHIGAITHVIEAFPNIKIWAPPFARALIKRKLAYKSISHNVADFTEDKVFNIGALEIHPIHVNHSIPDTYGLLLKSKDSNDFSIFFASDFKIDLNSPYEKPFNIKKINDLSSKSKKRIAFIDSTNITSRTKKTPSENDLIKNFENIFKESSGRVFVTCFSSNIHRIQTIINAAGKASKRVLPYGRAMVNYTALAKELGHLSDPKNVIQENVSNKNDQKLIILCSGCQGDFRGTLRRVISGTDAHFKPRSNDTFVFSSKAIPGNEKPISLLMNKIVEHGCKLITDADQLIHVSGHPGKTDLEFFYNDFKPTDVIPVHGESYFLKRHEEFLHHDFPDVKVHLLQNFDEVILMNNLEIKKQEGQKLAPILIYRNGLEIEREVISERRKAANEGVAFISLEWSSAISKNPHYYFSFLGLPFNVVKDETFKEDFDQFLYHLLRGLKRKDADHDTELIRIQSRQFLAKKLGSKPVVIIHIV